MSVEDMPIIYQDKNVTVRDSGKDGGITISPIGIFKQPPRSTEESMPHFMKALCSVLNLTFAEYKTLNDDEIKQRLRNKEMSS